MNRFIKKKFIKKMKRQNQDKFSETCGQIFKKVV